MNKQRFHIAFVLLVFGGISCQNIEPKNSSKDTIAHFADSDSIARQNLIKKGEIIPVGSDTSVKFDLKIDSLANVVYLNNYEPLSVKYIKAVQDADFKTSYVIELNNNQKHKTVLSAMIGISYPINYSDTMCNRPFDQKIKIELKPQTKLNLTVKGKNNCDDTPKVYIIKWVNSDGSFYPSESLSGISKFSKEMTIKNRIKDSLLKKFKSK